MTTTFAERQRNRRIRLDQIEDELDKLLVQRHELGQQETRLREERRQLNTALLETVTRENSDG